MGRLKSDIIKHMDNTNKPLQVPVSPVPAKSPLKRIFWINMGILLGYQALSLLGAGIIFGIKLDIPILFLIFGYIPHAFILFILSIVSAAKKDGRGKAFALTAVAILIIGFGLCTAVLFSGA